MPRQTEGPVLRRNPKKDRIYYIYWTDPISGRSREHSTRTRDQAQAAEYFARWLDKHHCTAEWTGPRRPSEVKIIDVLSLYADEHVATKIKSKAGRANIAYTIVTLNRWWLDRTLDFVKPANGASSSQLQPIFFYQLRPARKPMWATASANPDSLLLSPGSALNCCSRSGEVTLATSSGNG
jgi:hypothetical protein